MDMSWKSRQNGIKPLILGMEKKNTKIKKKLKIDGTLDDVLKVSVDKKKGDN